MPADTVQCDDKGRSMPGGVTEGFTGRVTFEEEEKCVQRTKGSNAFLVGPAPLLTALLYTSLSLWLWNVLPLLCARSFCLPRLIARSRKCISPLPHLSLSILPTQLRALPDLPTDQKGHVPVVCFLSRT